MNTSVWIRINGKKMYGKWGSGLVQAFKSKPATSATQLAIRVDLEIPDSFFELPELKATIKVPESTGRDTIYAEVKKSISDTLTKQMGIKVHLTTDETIND